MHGQMALQLGRATPDLFRAAMNRADDGATAAIVGNPSGPDFEMVRTDLLPGLLKTLSSNKVSHGVRRGAVPVGDPRPGGRVPHDANRVEMVGCWSSPP